jgi:gluconolactonase
VSHVCGTPNDREACLRAHWIFGRTGEPVARIRACEGLRVTNVAYGGSAMTTLFMTEADSGAGLAADVDVPGQPMSFHAD